MTMPPRRPVTKKSPTAAASRQTVQPSKQKLQSSHQDSVPEDESDDIFGSMNDFASIFQSCHKVLSNQDYSTPDEGKAKKEKKVNNKKNRHQEELPVNVKPASTASETLSSDSMESDEESSRTRKLLSEFDEFMLASRSNPSASGSTIAPQRVQEDAHGDSDSTMSLEDTDDVVEIMDTDIKDLNPNADIVQRVEYLNVRVHWRSTVHKFRMAETDKIAKLRYTFAKAAKVVAEEILFFLDEEVLEDSKTFKESNVALGVVLEAIRTSTKEPKVVPPSNQPVPKKRPIVVKDLTMIRIKLQGTNGLKDFIHMDVKRTITFERFQELYAEKMMLQPDQVMFRFDGDILDLDDTPETLELEDDEMIEVIISK